MDAGTRDQDVTPADIENVHHNGASLGGDLLYEYIIIALADRAALLRAVKDAAARLSELDNRNDVVTSLDAAAAKAES